MLMLAAIDWIAAAAVQRELVAIHVRTTTLRTTLKNIDRRIDDDLRWN